MNLRALGRKMMAGFYKEDDYLSQPFYDPKSNEMKRQVTQEAYARYQAHVKAEAEAAETQRQKEEETTGARWDAMLNASQERTKAIHAEMAPRVAGLLAKIDPALVPAAIDAHMELDAARTYVDDTRRQLADHLASKPTAHADVTAWIRTKHDLEEALPLYSEIVIAATARYNDALIAVRTALEPHARAVHVAAVAKNQKARERANAMLTAADERYEAENTIAEYARGWTVEG